MLIRRMAIMTHERSVTLHFMLVTTPQVITQDVISFSKTLHIYIKFSYVNVLIFMINHLLLELQHVNR